MARNTYFDLNNDGKEDIFWFNITPSTGLYTGHLSYWQSNGTTFDWKYLGYADPAWSPFYYGDFSNDGTGVDIGYINYDFSTSTGSFGYMKTAGNPVAFQSWGSFGTSGAGWTFDWAADMSGDGTDDLIFSNWSTGEVGYWDVDNGNVTNWHVLGSANQAIGNYNQWAPVEFGDFSGDGRADVFWHNRSSGDVGMWTTTAAGTAQWSSLGNVGAGWFTFAANDMNGDGNADVVWAKVDITQTTSIWSVGFWELDTGTPKWTFIGQVTNGWVVAGVGDFTGDGAADVLLVSGVGNGDTESQVGYWEMNTGGVFDHWQYVGTTTAGDGWIF